MISWIVRTAWSLLVLGVLTYATFFVPIGERTLFQHLSRIARTEEAQELGREVGDASARASVEVARQVEEMRSTGDGEGAEGTPPSP